MPAVRYKLGSVLGLLLFAVYCSPVADVIASHGVRHHASDADDTQLHLAMRADNTADGLYPFLPRVPLMSSSGICRTDSS
jgi:hypothetical protein